MKKYLLILFALIFLSGCGKTKVLHFFSPDRTQCITIFNVDQYRYLVNGMHKKLPNSEFIKLNMQNIDPLRDQLYICWKEKYLWDVTINNSEIIEITIDTSKFHFNRKLPLDERGIPTEKKFKSKNCAIFDFYSMKLSPNKGAIVEY
ncbi:MAG: lipoprotein [Bacteroidetes bacterium]|nr:lipoprotein [Bacteroidota bacterium]